MMLQEIEAFMRRTKMTPSRFSKDATGDPNFVEGLRNGRQPRPKTVDRVRAYMKGNDNA